MVELSITVKLIILFAVIVIVYLLLRFYMDYDILEVLWESITELEYNLTAVIITLALTLFMWAVIWLNPLWIKSTYFTFGKKMFLTITFPIVGYVLAVRGLNKD